MSKMSKIFVLVLICIVSNIGHASAAITYKTSVDYDYGFYKVIGIGQKPANDTENSWIYYTTVNYTNKNLTISVGDTVMWINYDPKDWQLTIISEQGLWNESNSRLRWSYQKFNYTFTEPGKYYVYVKENDKLYQTIVVNPIETPFEVTETTEPVITPIITLTQVATTETPKNTTSGFGAIGTIMAILMTLYFWKKH